MPAVAVVDASVAVKWLVPEHGSADAVSLAERWARDETRVIAPVLLWTEVSNVLHQRVRSGKIGRDEAARLIAWLTKIGLEPRSEVSLCPRALVLATEHGLTNSYDAIYLALAEAAKAVLWTADRKLHTAVGQQFTWVRLLGEKSS